jgi:peptidoglycan/xylan/chitin deacetylase (PgdA/CDA1 family)
MKWPRRNAAWVFYQLGITNVLHRAMKQSPSVALLYHRVYREQNELGAFSMGEIHVSNLKSQLRWVAEHCVPQDLESWLDGLKDKERHGPPRVLITFDDGYADFLKHAVPICAELGIRPVVFLPTDFIENPKLRPWWDVVYRAKPPQNLHDSFLQELKNAAWTHLQDPIPHVLKKAQEQGWTQLNLDSSNEFSRWEDFARAKDLITIGSHGLSHSPFSRLSPSEANSEVYQSLQIIKNRLDVAPMAFAYPYGSTEEVNEASLKILQNGPYRAAFRAGGKFDSRKDSEWNISRCVFPPRPVWSFAAHWVSVAKSSLSAS